MYFTRQDTAAALYRVNRQARSSAFFSFDNEFIEILIFEILNIHTYKDHNIFKSLR